MSYLEYYGLAREPFSNAPEARFYYDAEEHRRALLRLGRAASEMKGLALLVGDIGTGKTTLARRLLDTLGPESYEAALLVIVHSGITASWLLRRIAEQLGVEAPAEDKVVLLGQLYRRLVEIHEEGRKAVVLVDEAQMLASREVMEELRGLLNLEVPGSKLVTLVLFGLPEMEEAIRLDPPLAQRVAVRCRLEHLAAGATGAYVHHRLSLAGAQRVPFTPEALSTIHQLAAGTPRVINTLCDNALFEGFVSQKPDLDERHVMAVARDLALVGHPEAATPGPALQARLE